MKEKRLPQMGVFYFCFCNLFVNMEFRATTVESLLDGHGLRRTAYKTDSCPLERIELVCELKSI